jgi:ligand-binding sensor domain-containing protein
MPALEKCLHRALPTVLLLILCTSAALGAPPRPNYEAERWTGLADTVFQNLVRDNEMPNSATAQALTQDAAGFVWVGTQNGLARWDGYRFRTYQSDPASPGTLPDNYIFTLHTDSRGRLWIGTGSGGLARYDPEHDRFVRYPTGPNGLSHVSIRNIADDGAGGIWVATEGGLDQISPQTGTITHFRHDERDPGSLPDNHIMAVRRSRNGTLWVGTDHGVVRHRAKGHGSQTDPGERF